MGKNPVYFVNTKSGENMARKKLKKPSLLAIKALKFPNLPTQERIKKGGVRIKNNIGQVDEPLRIDKLLSNGIIDEMQHLYGMQIITLWTIANRPFIKASKYEPNIIRTAPSFEFINISRMSAEDKFHKTMSFLSKRDEKLIAKICFDELPAIEAGKSLGLPINSITVYLRSAFDALGDALAKMRSVKKELEKQDKST